MNSKTIFTFLLLVIFNLTAIPLKAQTAISLDNQQLPTPKLRVGVAGEPPGVMIPAEDMDSDTAMTGIAVEMWKILANALELKYELVYDDTVINVLDKLVNQEIDIAIGSITVTNKNVTRFDFTQPIYQDTLTILTPIKSQTLWGIIKPFLTWAFFSSVIVIWLCLFIVGNLLWLAERHHNSEQFPNSYLKGVAEGMWCALTTFSTVGYGDRYPIDRWVLDGHFRRNYYHPNGRDCYNFSDRFFCPTLPKFTKT
jgi:ABC-type amino acid transport substrate-binding protein